MNRKTIAMLAHLSPVGWLIAWALNSRTRDQYASFYLRQLLGIYLLFIATRFIPDYYIFAWGLLFVFWTYSFIGPVKDAEHLVPFIGDLFQKWFKKIAR